VSEWLWFGGMAEVDSNDIDDGLLSVIPKESATFHFVFQQRVFTLFGDALRQRALARGKKQGRGKRHGNEGRLPFFVDG
jgi:hypothetical protein